MSSEITANGTRIAYHDGRGNGPAVVFLHALPLSAEMWRDQMKALSGIARPIAVDFRGFGASEVGDGQYLLELFVDDCLTLLQQLGIERAVFCGLSMGGFVAQRLAERAPERVAALVLADTRSNADSDEAKVNRAGQVRRLHAGETAKYLEELLPNLFAPGVRESRPDLYDRVRSIAARNAPRGIAGAIIALAARTDTTAGLAKIAVPTLFIVGEQDKVSPPDVMKAMADKVKGSRYVTIPNAGHFSALENPEAFNQALIEFVQSL